MVTLHHFTTPLWLTHRGGWENPAIIPFFERFAEKMAQALGEYCNLWITLNEPVDLRGSGLARWSVPRDEKQPQSTFPPGKHDLLLTFRVLENLFLGPCRRVPRIAPPTAGGANRHRAQHALHRPAQ